LLAFLAASLVEAALLPAAFAAAAATAT